MAFFCMVWGGATLPSPVGEGENAHVLYVVLGFIIVLQCYMTMFIFLAGRPVLLHVHRLLPGLSGFCVFCV